MKGLTWVILMLFSITAMGQEGIFSIGPQVSTNGYGLRGSLASFTMQDHTFSSAFHAELSTLRHIKETKVKSNILPSPDKYVYGKAKRAFHLSIGYGLEHTISAMTVNEPGVSIGWSLSPDFAFTRPVYVYVIDYRINENARQQLTKYTRDVHNEQSNIQGDAGWTYGFKDIQFTPGIDLSFYTKISFHKNFSTRTVMAGVDINAYTRDLGVMLDAKNQVFTSLFISYQLGNKP